MAEELNMKFVVDTSKPVSSITELQTRIETLRSKIEGAPLGSESFKRLQTQLQNASSEMKVLEKNMEGLEPQQKAEAFLKMGEGIAGGFAVAQGAMGLLGIESENLEKIQVKVQSAIAIAMGVRMMAEAGLMFATAKRLTQEKLAIIQTKLIAVNTGLATKALRLYRTAMRNVGLSAKVSVKGVKALKVAIASTGIGLLIVAIGALVTYWDDIKAAVSGVSDEQQKQLQLARDTKDAALKNLEATEGSTNQLKLQGKSQKEIVKLKLKDIDAAIQASEVEIERQKSMKKSQMDAARRNQDIAEGIIMFLTSPISMLLGMIDGITAGLAEFGLADATNLLDDYTGTVAGWLGFNADETEKEIDATIQESEDGLNKLREKRAGFQLSLNDINNKNSNKRKENQTQAQDEELQRLEAFLKDLQATYDDFNMTAEEKELQAVRDKYDKLLQEAEHFGYDTAILKEQLEQELQEIEDRYAEERKQKRLDEIDEQKAAELELLNQKLDTAKQLLDSFNQNIDARMTELENQKNRELQVENLTEEEKEKINKKFDRKQKRLNKRRKAIAASQAIINTYQGATAAYTSLAPIPYVGPILGGIAAGAAITAGLANVRKIYAQDVGDGGGGGGASGGGTASTPQTPRASAPRATTGAFTLGGGGNAPEPVKAYVVTDEMTNSQNQLESIRQQSTI